MCITALCTIFSAVSSKAYAGYGILVNGKDYYDASYQGPDPYGEGFEQYLAHVYVHSGDYCQLYDADNQASWAVKLNSSSVTAFTLNNDRYTCSTDGCYDFYIKLKYQNDQLYIGPGSNCSTTPDTPGGDTSASQDYSSAVPSQCEDVMLQAFYWNSYTDQTYGGSKWGQLTPQAEEIAKNFNLVWLSPSCQSNDQMGYLPKIYSNQNSTWGLRAELNQLIKALHAGGAKVIADVVINHAANKSSWVDFMTQDFGEYGKFEPQSTWITSNDEAQGKGTLGSNADDGQHEPNYPSARDWDHKNTQVQAMCKAYLKWLKGFMNYDGYRFDYAGGYHVSHINDYVSAAKPYFSVMEYWDGDANNLKTRIDQAGKNTLTFDFAAYYTALQNGIAKNNYSGCKSAGLRGKGYSKYAVLFVDNHDTFNRNGSTDPVDVGGSKDGKTTIANRDLMLQCNAYILSMPGVPCVFWPHWYKYKSEIKAMIHARKSAGIHSESTMEEQSGSGWYKATVYGKAGNVVLYLGSAASEAAPAGYKQAIKESKVAMYYTGDETRGVEQVSTQPKSEKFMQDGKLYIRCGERIYDAQGKLIY